MERRQNIIRRKSSKGANLALLCAVGALLIGMLGICMYSGGQAFIQSEMQKAANTAAMAGAAAMYSNWYGSDSKPAPDATQARNVATATFNNMITNSGVLRGFNVQMAGIPNVGAGNDSVTVRATGSMETPFLGLAGIRQIDITATATARALRYEPTRDLGPVSILPQNGNAASYSRTIKLAFPLVDNPGNDLYVEQDPTMQQGYTIEACNDTECYDVTGVADPVDASVGGTSRLRNPSGVPLLYGTATIDLARAGVSKASALRFTHGNQFDSYSSGVANPPLLTPTPLTVDRVMLFGYAGACVNETTCPIPAGFAAVR